MHLDVAVADSPLGAVHLTCGAVFDARATRVRPWNEDGTVPPEVSCPGCWAVALEAPAAKPRDHLGGCVASDRDHAGPCRCGCARPVVELVRPGVCIWHDGRREARARADAELPLPGGAAETEWWCAALVHDDDAKSVLRVCVRQAQHTGGHDLGPVWDPAKDPVELVKDWNAQLEVDAEVRRRLEGEAAVLTEQMTERLAAEARRSSLLTAAEDAGMLEPEAAIVDVVDATGPVVSLERLSQSVLDTMPSLDVRAVDRIYFAPGWEDRVRARVDAGMLPLAGLSKAGGSDDYQRVVPDAELAASPALTVDVTATAGASTKLTAAECQRLLGHFGVEGVVEQCPVVYETPVIDAFAPRTVQHPCVRVAGHNGEHRAEDGMTWIELTRERDPRDAPLEEALKEVRSPGQCEMVHATDLTVGGVPLGVLRCELEHGHEGRHEASRTVELPADDGEVVDEADDLLEHPKFDAFKEQRLKNPEIRAAYDAARARNAARPLVVRNVQYEEPKRRWWQRRRPEQIVTPGPGYGFAEVLPDDAISEARVQLAVLGDELARLIRTVTGQASGPHTLYLPGPMPPKTDDPQEDRVRLLTWRLRGFTAYVAAHADEAQG